MVVNFQGMYIKLLTTSSWQSWQKQRTFLWPCKRATEPPTKNYRDVAASCSEPILQKQKKTPNFCRNMAKRNLKVHGLFLSVRLEQCMGTLWHLVVLCLCKPNDPLVNQHGNETSLYIYMTIFNHVCCWLARRPANLSLYDHSTPCKVLGIDMYWIWATIGTSLHVEGILGCGNSWGL